MIATPEASSFAGKKRYRNEVADYNGELLRRNAMTMINLNRDLLNYRAATTKELKLRENIERSRQTVHEFILIDVVTEPDGRNFLLYILRHETFSEICSVKGLRMNSRSRGDVTRVVMDISLFARFRTDEMRTAFEQIDTTKSLRFSESKVHINSNVDESDAIEIARLNFYWTKKKKEFQTIILEQYKQKRKYESDASSLQSELTEEKERSILLSAALYKERKNTDRRVAGQRGAGTRYSNIILYV